jgi:hypothetical protein
LFKFKNAITIILHHTCIIITLSLPHPLPHSLRPFLSFSFSLSHAQGEIYINGIPIEEIRDWYVANTGYVLQLAAPYYEELTVRENLTLAAQMKLPKMFTMREKFERVEQVMEVVRTCIVCRCWLACYALA